MKHLLSILCLFVLSCDDDNLSPCENLIIGKWQLLNIDWEYTGSEECCDEDCQAEIIEDTEGYQINALIVEFPSNIDSYCYNDNTITLCTDEESEDCRNDYEFSINGDILTVSNYWGDETDNCEYGYMMMTSTFERVE